jgi:hypothetical protein
MLAKTENPEQVLAEIERTDTLIEAMRRDLIHMFARDGDEHTAQEKRRIEKEIQLLQAQRATVEARLTNEADRLKAEGERALDAVFRLHSEYGDSLRAFEQLIRELQNLHGPGRERAQALLDLKAARRLQILQSNIAGLAFVPLP